MIYEVLEYPNPKLKEKSTLVETVDAEIKQILSSMLETMYSSNGIGLAAPQVGVLKRMIVVDLSLRDEDALERTPMFLINPKIIETSEERQIGEEGCLSVPKQSAEVERFYKIKVAFFDENGNEQILVFEDFPAVVIQHEMDHLDGKLYIDRISRLKRQVVLKKLEKYREGVDE